MGIVRKGFQAMFQRGKWKILRGDKVQIMAGKDKGQVGTVLKVIRDEKYPRVMVEGLNLSKRHVKRSGDNPGGIISVESPLHYSKVALVDPVTNSPVRATWRWLEDGTKVRISKGRLASGTIIPRPDVLKQRRKPLPVKAGPQDTPAKEAAKVTHKPGDLPSFLRPGLLQMAGQQQQRRQFGSGVGLAGLLGLQGGAVGGGGGGLLGAQRRFWRGFAAGLL